MKRLSILLLALSALLLLGGCAIEPTYHYTRTVDGGGYYNGQSAYGNADTVVYGDVYADPWVWNPWWGYGYYGPRWGGFGFGVTYTYRDHHRHREHRAYRHGSSHTHSRHSRDRHSTDRQPQPVRHP